MRLRQPSDARTQEAEGHDNKSFEAGSASFLDLPQWCPVDTVRASMETRVSWGTLLA